MTPKVTYILNIKIWQHHLPKWDREQILVEEGGDDEHHDHCHLVRGNSSNILVFLFSTSDIYGDICEFYHFFLRILDSSEKENLK